MKYRINPTQATILYFIIMGVVMFTLTKFNIL